MNNLNPELIMAIITVVAVFSPVITNYMNNKHQIKMLKLENYELAKYKAIDNFIKATEEYYCDQSTVANFVNFNSSIANLYIYFSVVDHPIFDKIKECIEEQDYNKTQFAIGELIKILAKQIDKD